MGWRNARKERKLARREREEVVASGVGLMERGRGKVDGSDRGKVGETEVRTLDPGRGFAENQSMSRGEDDLEIIRVEEDVFRDYIDPPPEYKPQKDGLTGGHDC
jgi:hypothetical protein